MNISILTFLGIILILQTEGYKQFQSEDEEKVYCMHKMHYIVSPTSTCCNTSVIKSGFYIEDEDWKGCGTKPTDADTVEKATWAVYSCMIKKKNGDEESITLSKFAELMTKQYPDEFKTKIVEEVGTLGDVTADLSDSAALNKLRVSYFDVEREVCNQMPSDTKEYGKSTECMPWDEEGHRGGICCDSISYPIDIGYKSYMGTDFTLNMDSCNTTLFPLLNMLQATDMMAVNIVEMCDLTCEMIDKNTLTVDADLQMNAYQNVDFLNKIAGIVLPSFLSSVIKERAVAFASSRFNINQTIERIDEYEFADVIAGNSSTERPVFSATYVVNKTKIATDGNKLTTNLDFMRRKFPNNIKHVPVICTAHKQIMSYLQYYLETKECIKE